jgi:uncharacterized membrane protein
MSDWYDTPTDVVAILAIFSVLLGAVGWWIRAEIRKNNAEIKANGEQLQPNHGTTMRDAVDRIEAALSVVHDDIKSNAAYARQDVTRLDEKNSTQHGELSAQLLRVNDRVNDHLTDHLAEARDRINGGHQR